MDGHNQWRSYLDLEPAEDELTSCVCVFQSQREEEPMSIPGYQQQQNYTSPTAVAPNPFSPGFPSFWGPASSSFGAVAAAARDDDPIAFAGAGQLASSLLSFGGGQAGTFMHSGASSCPEQDCVVDAVQVQVQVQQVPAERRPPWNALAHVIAERGRRQKMRQQFVALATIVPDLTKVDKLSVLGSTIEYVKQPEEKVKALEEQSSRSRTTPSTFTSTSTLLGSKCRRVVVPVPADNDDDLSDDSDEIPITSAGAGSNSNPTAVEAVVHADTVLLKICCKDKRGVLVVVLSELEKRGLSILDTSVLPFTDSCLNIDHDHCQVQIGEGFSNTGDLVNNLTKVIRGFT